MVTNVFVVVAAVVVAAVVVAVAAAVVVAAAEVVLLQSASKWCQIFKKLCIVEPEWVVVVLSVVGLVAEPPSSGKQSSNLFRYVFIHLMSWTRKVPYFVVGIQLHTCCCCGCCASIAGTWAISWRGAPGWTVYNPMSAPARYCT